MITWHPHVHPIVSGFILLVLGVWLVWLFRRNRKVYGKAACLVLLTPRVLVTVLLLLALFDPCVSTVRPPEQRGKFRVMLDVSDSMAVKDRDGESRAGRAEDLARIVRDGLGDWVDIETRTFDVDIHASGAEPEAPPRGTDIGTCMAMLAEEEGMPGHAGVLLLTDGGDEPVRTARTPGPPVYIVGVGSDPSTWNDLSLKNVDAPDIVEENTPFEVSGDVFVYRADPSFASKATRAKLTVSEEAGDGWTRIEEQSVDLREGHRRFTVEMPKVKEECVKRYRLSVKPIDGELSLLNNDRTITVEVRKKEVYVLFYARYIDWNFTLLKRALKEDPAVKVTALYCRGNDTMGNDLFRLEGDRREGDEILRRGLPADEKLLSSYRCVVLGSFPARELKPRHYEALLRYVEQGGAVIFLGGEDSFGRGGFSETAIAPLFPWHISLTERELTAGVYPVTATDLAREHRATSAAAKTLGEVPVPRIYSVNRVGRLRPGAVSLMDVTVGRRVIAVVALQPYGLGQTVGIATDTLWRWGRKPGKIKKVHKQFWQQLIRYMCGDRDGGRFLSVKWDRPSYRPSEMAEPEVRVIGRKQMAGQLRMKGELIREGVSEEVTLEPVLGKAGCYKARVYFPRRGEYTFHLEAFVGTERLDRYERKFHVAPRVNEGANLELDEPFLADLAGRCGGYYENESNVDELVDMIRKKVMTGSVQTSVPLVQERWVYVSLFMLILVAEWIVRRSMNIF
jgi:hypothetical protein